jgi:hypothetical protein
VNFRYEEESTERVASRSQQSEKKVPPPLDWRVFRVRSVQVCLFNHCESPAPLSQPERRSGRNLRGPVPSLSCHLMPVHPTTRSPNAKALPGASNNMNYALGQWGPTYFVELGVPRAEIGAWLALPGTVSVWGAFLIGWLEGRAIRGGMTQLRLRRVFTQVCAFQPFLDVSSVE